MGITIKRQTDELTGLFHRRSGRQRASGAGKDMRPTVKLVDANGKDVMIRAPTFPPSTSCRPTPMVNLEDGANVGVGDAVARIPQESRRPATSPVVCRALPICSKHVVRKRAAILAEISGTISFGKETKGKRRLVITRPMVAIRTRDDSEVASPERVRR